MSHNITVNDIKINDLTALQDAVNELAAEGVKISLTRDSHFRSYSASTSGKKPIVINLPDSPYDLAFDVDKEGNYVPIFDPWRGHIQKQIGWQSNELDAEVCDINSPGVHIGRLVQRYATCKIEREAALAGRTVTRGGLDPKTKQFNLTVSNY